MLRLLSFGLLLVMNELLLRGSVWWIMYYAYASDVQQCGNVANGLS
ncbi:hypothetical protein [Anaplasma phagocytophilum]|nr:hypothetical protein [Anaplasma phagocytophilum]